MAEIWVADFEYISIDGDGNNPIPVCFCATEIISGKKIRQWLHGIDRPEPLINFKSDDLIYVSYNAIAEMSCHLVLGWAIPKNILDLYCEWRVLTNDGQSHEKGYNGLLNACKHFGIKTIDQEYKSKMQNRVIAGAPYSEDEKNEILDYCESDVIETIELYKHMKPYLKDIQRASFRGRYMAINAAMTHAGVPIDVGTLRFMRDNWDTIKLEIIKEVNKEFNFFDGLTFKKHRFAEYLYTHDMQWELTENGNLSLKEQTFKDMVKTYPFLQPVKEAKSLLERFKVLHITCGFDGRNRGRLMPFGAKTGRNTPKVECIFTNPSWLRGLIKPNVGKTLAYIDFEQQEFMVAGMLSGDKQMQETYYSGDPYLRMAKLAGAIPPEGTKKTHKATRDTYKQACLAIQYGMGARNLAIRINKPLAYAQEILRQHKRLFPQYWEWQENVRNQAKLHKRIHTKFGWCMSVTHGGVKEDLTLGNFLMQATGADILRVACHLLTNAGIQVIAPVHDALMIEVNAKNDMEEIIKAENIMHEASAIVIGKPLRTETVIVRYPNRYLDEKGKATWDKVQKIIEGIKDGSIKPDPYLQSIKMDKHIEKLDRISHNNLSNWFDEVDKDTIDFEALHDSTLSATENRKNLKGMWKEHIQ